MAKTTNDNVPLPLAAGRTLKAIDQVDCYPVVASPKFDGYRCITLPPVTAEKTGEEASAWSRRQKPIPNLYVQEVLAQVPHFLDGELTVGDTFQSSAAVTRKSSEPIDFIYWVFDYFHPAWVDTTWSNRMANVRLLISELPREVAKHVRVCPMMECHHAEHLEEAWDAFAQYSSEGLMLRTTAHDDKYVFGKGSKSLIKLKPLAQTEGKIVGFEEEKYGTNLKTVPEELWGTTKGRHSALILEGLPDSDFPGVRFRVGTGMNHALRKEIFDNEEKFVGQVVTFRYLPSGTKDKPRHPAFIGFRPDWDL